jgi:protein-tyrosine-phosphatase
LCQAADPPSIVFVCEHGAAKSLIATAYFNKLASERGMTVRATFLVAMPNNVTNPIIEATLSTPPARNTPARYHQARTR